jgi:malic enzyme
MGTFRLLQAECVAAGVWLCACVLAQFVRAVMGRWPNAVLQFEDFQMQHALTLLERYRQ